MGERERERNGREKEEVREKERSGRQAGISRCGNGEEGPVQKGENTC